MDQFFQLSADFIGSCQKDEDCYEQYGQLYQCFTNKNQCYQCLNSGNYHCEGDYCISDVNCALGMCKNYACTYEESSNMFWIVVLYIVLGCVACCVCCCCVACGMSCWERLVNYLKQKKINRRAKDDPSCQILLEIFSAMRRNDYYNSVLFEGVSENLKIIEKDSYQGRPMEDIKKAVEFQADSFEQYFHHFSNQYGRYQTSYITNIYNYSGSDTILAKIIKKSYDGYKVEYFVSASFTQHKLYRMELSITPKLTYFQQRAKEQQKYRSYNIPYTPPVSNTNNNHDNFGEEERRRQEENMRGAAHMRQQEEARRQQEEYDRQQQQFRDNMRRQEEQQREYQRQQQMIAEQRYREAQQALMKQNQSRW